MKSNVIMDEERSTNVAYHVGAQYIVGENKFPRYIVDKSVDMCITKIER